MAILNGIVLHTTVLTLTLSSLSSACEMKEFCQNDNKRLLGNVIQKTINVHLRQCQRMCKLYTECFAFNMKWTDKDRLEGDCEVLGPRREADFDASVKSNAEYSYFADCPQPAVYPTTTQGSYIVFREEMLGWTEADIFCHQLEPTAHLVELQTQQEETALMELLSLDLGLFWIGAKRRDGGGPEDIIWTHSNVSVAADRVKWFPTNPTMIGQCIYVTPVSEQLQWMDLDCTSFLQFICQYE